MERYYIKTLIPNRSCLNCTNGCCRVEYCDKVVLDEFGKPQGSKCVSWENDRIVGEYKVLKLGRQN